MHFLPLLIFLSTLVRIRAQDSCDFYISEFGNDINDGMSISTPF